MKKIVKYILRSFGWKLIKIQKPPRPHPYGKLNLEVLDCMNNASGIMHLGGHRGNEAEVYNWFGKKAIWFEAIPDYFQHLKEHLYFYTTQKAYCALLGDSDNIEKTFYVSNCDAGCSSLFNFSKEVQDKVYWAENNYKMTKKLTLKMSKLDTILEKNKISASDYNHWIIDLQGAELLALKGAENSLKSCKSIYTEISKLNFYEGGVLWPELSEWLREKGFYPVSESTEDHSDVLFKRK